MHGALELKSVFSQAIGVHALILLNLKSDFLRLKEGEEGFFAQGSPEKWRK